MDQFRLISGNRSLVNLLTYQPSLLMYLTRKMKFNIGVVLYLGI